MNKVCALDAAAAPGATTAEWRAVETYATAEFQDAVETYVDFTPGPIPRFDSRTRILSEVAKTEKRVVKQFLEVATRKRGSMDVVELARFEMTVASWKQPNGNYGMLHVVANGDLDVEAALSVYLQAEKYRLRLDGLGTMRNIGRTHGRIFGRPFDLRRVIRIIDTHFAMPHHAVLDFPMPPDSPNRGMRFVTWFGVWNTKYQLPEKRFFFAMFREDGAMAVEIKGADHPVEEILREEILSTVDRVALLYLDSKL